MFSTIMGDDEAQARLDERRRAIMLCLSLAEKYGERHELKVKTSDKLAFVEEEKRNDILKLVAEIAGNGIHGSVGYCDLDIIKKTGDILIGVGDAKNQLFVRGNRESVDTLQRKLVHYRRIQKALQASVKTNLAIIEMLQNENTEYFKALDNEAS